MSDAKWMQALRKDPLIEKAEAEAAQAERQRHREIANQKAAAEQAKDREAQEEVDRLVDAFPHRFHEMKEDLKKNAPIEEHAERSQAGDAQRPSLLPAQREKQELEARFHYAREELAKRKDSMREVVGDRAVERQFKQLTAENEWKNHLDTIEGQNGFRERTRYESEAKGVVLSPESISDIEATRNARRMWHEGMRGPSHAEITEHISTAKENGNWPLPSLHTGPGSKPQLNENLYSYDDFIRDCETQGRVHTAPPIGHQARAEASPPDRSGRNVRNANVEPQLGQRIPRLHAPLKTTPIARAAQPSLTRKMQKPFQHYAAPSPPQQTSARPRFVALLARAVGGVARWISDLRPDSATKPRRDTWADKAATGDVNRRAGPRTDEDATRDRTKGMQVQSEARQVDPVAALKVYLDKPLPPVPAERAGLEQSARRSGGGRGGQETDRRPVDLSRAPAAMEGRSQFIAESFSLSGQDLSRVNGARHQLVAARDRESRAGRSL